MAAEAILDFLSNYTGNVAKAQITIFDVRGDLNVATDKPVDAGGNSAGGLAGGVAGAATEGLSSVADDPSLFSVEAIKYNPVTQVVNGNSITTQVAQTPVAIRKIAAGAEARTFEVQFNPSSLHVSGRAGGMVPMQQFSPDDTKKERPVGMTYEAMAPRISVECQLIFDAEDNSDCFLGDKIQTNVTGIGKEVTKSIVKMAGGYKRTVQQQVEGFIAAIRSDNTRLIKFEWGDMTYEGVLNHVRATYTMFNTNGEPVRASVAFSLLVMDENLGGNDEAGFANTIAKESKSLWAQYYEAAFCGSSSLVRAAQKAGSLVNLSL